MDRLVFLLRSLHTSSQRNVHLNPDRCLMPKYTILPSPLNQNLPHNYPLIYTQGREEVQNTRSVFKSLASFLCSKINEPDSFLFNNFRQLPKYTTHAGASWKSIMHKGNFKTNSLLSFFKLFRSLFILYFHFDSQTLLSVERSKNFHLYNNKTATMAYYFITGTQIIQL